MKRYLVKRSFDHNGKIYSTYYGSSAKNGRVFGTVASDLPYQNIPLTDENVKKFGYVSRGRAENNSFYKSPRLREGFTVEIVEFTF